MRASAPWLADTRTNWPLTFMPGPLSHGDTTRGAMWGHGGAVLSSDGLHALGVRRVGGSTSRLVRWGDAQDHFFSNPMWRMYGHGMAHEAGAVTHSWQSNQAGELF